MSESVYPLIDLRAAALPLPPASDVAILNHSLLDMHERPLHDLRISVTDRCNFRCSYCMPKEVFDKDYAYLPHKDLLSFEEITRLAKNFVALGVRKIRLTGGEPLLRKNIEILIEQLASLRTPDGTPLDLTLTTNGSLLARKAQSLKDAGLQRVTVSLDGLDDAVFRRMNDVDFPVQDVLDGIERAQQVGLGPVKVNMVVKKGTNEQEIVPMARHFRNSGVHLRFIEYMDVGATNGWRMDEVLPSAEVLNLLQQQWPMVALEQSAVGETAQRWGYANAAGQYDKQAGEIGLISSVTQAF
ncbi:MAG: Cyclic pyranopterin monophosphate synthase, partial [Pseudomonadota bacterium]